MSVIGILIGEIIITFVFIPGTLAYRYVGQSYVLAIIAIGFGWVGFCFIGIGFIGFFVNRALSIGTALFQDIADQLDFFTLGTYLGGGLATFVWVIIDDCYCEDNCEK